MASPVMMEKQPHPGEWTGCRTGLPFCPRRGKKNLMVRGRLLARDAGMALAVDPAGFAEQTSGPAPRVAMTNSPTRSAAGFDCSHSSALVLTQARTVPSSRFLVWRYLSTIPRPVPTVPTLHAYAHLHVVPGSPPARRGPSLSATHPPSPAPPEPPLV